MNPAPAELDDKSPKHRRPNAPIGAKRPPRYHGLLLLDKPADHTSHDAVAIIRGLSGQKRVGHSGTLDPLATGLMVLLLGEATKLEPYLVKMDKLYTGRLELGLSTDTDDVSGQTLSRKNGPWPAESEIQARLKAYEGDGEQIPPAFSAIKVYGRRAYKAARAGQKVELKPRPVSARRLDLLAYQPPQVEFLAEVSSGYYIRSLVRDLGAELGLGAALTALRRERVGQWSIERAFTIEDIRGWGSGDWAEKLIDPAEALPHLETVRLDQESEKAFRQGRAVPSPVSVGRGECKVLNGQGRLIGLAGQVSERTAPLTGQLCWSDKSDEASLGGQQAPRQPFLRPLRVFNFGSAEQPDGKE